MFPRVLQQMILVQGKEDPQLGGQMSLPKKTSSAETRIRPTCHLLALGTPPTLKYISHNSCSSSLLILPYNQPIIMATKEVAWLRRLLKEIGCQQNNLTPLFCDNQSAIRTISH